MAYTLYYHPLSSYSWKALIALYENATPFEKVVVHGHTPVLEPQFLQNRINIDTGAYATGKLTCLRIEGFDLRVI